MRCRRAAARADDMLRVGDVLVHFIETNPGAAAFRKEALAELKPALAAAQKACLAANPFLVHRTEVVRAVFGPTSRQYKQFIERSASENAAVDTAATTGEPAPAAAPPPN